MTSQHIRNLATIPLFVTYLCLLSMSTFHLARFYDRFNTGLPSFLGYGFAASLELAGFTLSVISNMVKPRSVLASRSSTITILLVWAGNAYEMTSSGQHILAVIGASCFSPLTLLIGKVIGELLETQTVSELDISRPRVRVRKTQELPAVGQTDQVQQVNVSDSEPVSKRGVDRGPMILKLLKAREATKENPVKCQEIAEFFKVSDKTARRYIDRLRELGAVESSSQGYWLTVREMN